MKRIFEAKGRPQDNPLIIHVTGAQWLPRYCADVPPLAYVLARKFWPGPLTMILKRRPIIPVSYTHLLRYEDLQAQLADPSVYGDAERLKTVNRELKDLTPVAEAYQAYRQAEADRAAAEELL